MKLLDSLVQSGYFEIEVRDKNGKLRTLWQENFVLRFLKKKFPLRDIPLIPFITGFPKTGMITVKNLITTAGKAGSASRTNGAGAEAAFTYLELGIGTTAANVADTTLESAITDSGLARAAGTCTRVTTTVTNDTAQITYTWTASGNKDVTEAGVFNASSAGTMLARQVFTAVPILSGDSVAFTYKIKSA